MTTAIDTSRAVQYVPSGIDVAKARPDTTAPAAEMDAATFTALSEAVTAMMVQNPDTTMKPDAAPAVQLRPAALTLGEATRLLGSITSKLPTLLAALLGAREPTTQEEGASLRASEGAAMATAKAVKPERADTPAINQTANGQDADINDRVANANVWLGSSPFANLLTLLRQLLMEFEIAERRMGAQMTIMQRDMVIAAGARGVEKAREALGGAIGAAVLTGVVGGAAMKQTYKSTNMQTTSIRHNQNAANAASVGVHDMRAGLKGVSAPTAELRPRRPIDAGAPDSQATPASQLQSDAEAASASMRTSALDSPARPEADMLMSHHASSMAYAQNPASNAMLLNMLAPAVGGTISAGVQIEAEMTEAERQLLLNVAETLSRIADGHQDQRTRTREMRDAASQLLDSMLNLNASTSGHIISKY